MKKDKVVEKGWWIEWNGFEPILHRYKKFLSGNSYKSETSAFYPFRAMKRKLYDYKKKREFKKEKYPIIQCQGCGGGICEWEIQDPNNRFKFIKVCQHCVDFYDIDFTKRRLELKWRTEIEMRR